MSTLSAQLDLLPGDHGDPDVRLWIPGKPMGKGRPRFARTPKGHVVAFTPTPTRREERRIAGLALAEMQLRGLRPHAGPVALSVVARFKRPASGRNRVGSTTLHTQKPDVDNCAKLLTDALQGVFYDDDSQIVAIRCEKRWTEGADGVEALAWFL